MEDSRDDEVAGAGGVNGDKTLIIHPLPSLPSSTPQTDCEITQGIYFTVLSHLCWEYLQTSV